MAAAAKTTVATKKREGTTKKPAAAKTKGVQQQKSDEGRAAIGIRLGDLVLSEVYNVRKTQPTAQGIANMAASIRAHRGVLQNLVVVPELDDAGQPTGRFLVAAGKRRTLGLRLIRDQPKPGFTVTDDYIVWCLVVTHAEAVAASTTENVQREPMHPADEFEAFKTMIDAGSDIEAVADAFGVSVQTVHRRLRLANASPRLFQLFRDGGIDQRALEALCIVDDPALQERAWDETPTYLRHANHLRDFLTQGQVAINGNRLAAFVGIEAYEAAGGCVLRDLFSNQGQGYIDDPVLLNRLAGEKLDALAAEVKAEGWSWVEIKPDFRQDDLYRSYTQSQARKRKPTDEEAQQLQALADERDAVQAKFAKLQEAFDAADEGGPSVSQEQYDEADALKARGEHIDGQVKALQAELQTYSNRVKSTAGAIVAIDHSGAPAVHRGLSVRSSSKAGHSHDHDGDDDGDGSTGSAQPAAADGGLSQALRLKLTANRTKALQVLVAGNTSLALVALAYALVPRVFHTLYAADRTVCISASSHVSLSQMDSSIEDSKAHKAFSALMSQWEQRFPEEEGDLFGFLQALPHDELLALIALCTAATIDTSDGRPLRGDAARLAASAGLDMADWWEPTASTFLANVPKAMVLNVVEQAVDGNASATLAKLKKGELVVQAETLIAGRRWLPQLLRQAA